MRTKDLDISKFASLLSVHDYLDENASKLSRNWDITKLFVKYRDYTSSSEEKQRAQWELECFLFEFRGLELMGFPLLVQASAWTPHNSAKYCTYKISSK